LSRRFLFLDSGPWRLGGLLARVLVRGVCRCCSSSFVVGLVVVVFRDSDGGCDSVIGLMTILGASLGQAWARRCPHGSEL
jgi:hypothetical protein